MAVLVFLNISLVNGGNNNCKPVWKCQPAPTIAPTPSTMSTGASNAFIMRSGTHLQLNGQQFTFRGLNIYNANSRNNCWYSLGNNDTALANSLAASKVKVFRAWFTQGEAITNGSWDWAAFDHTLSVAHSMGVYVIPVLSVEDCRGDGIRYTDWFSNGYKNIITSGHLVSFRDYASLIVNRYKNEPAILAWQIGNEFEIKNTDGTCGPATTLKAFADDMAALIKSIDSSHLVSLGTIGSGQCGASGSTDYKNLHSSNNIDLCEYHDYSTAPMPGDQWNGLQTRINDCTSLNKPLFVGEIGIVQSDPNRPQEMGQKINTQFPAGIVGFLPWEWRASGQTGGDSYIIPDGDPLISVMFP